LYSTSGGFGGGEVRITGAGRQTLGVLQMPQRGGEPRQQVCATERGLRRRPTLQTCT
jgi:hypothetical protein